MRERDLKLVPYAARRAEDRGIGEPLSAARLAMKLVVDGVRGQPALLGPTPRHARIHARTPAQEGDKSADNSADDACSEVLAPPGAIILFERRKGLCLHGHTR